MPPASRTRPLAGVGRVLLVAALALPAAAGCSSDGSGTERSAGARGTSASSSAPAAPSPSASSSGPPARPGVYVAVGASETVGVGADDPETQAWPVVLHERAVPRSRFVDVGVSGATVGDALRSQLPRALASDPDLVTVWLAVNDALSLVPVPEYEAQLRGLVRALRQDGRTEVLVANVPPLDRLPAYRACLPGSGVTAVPCLLPLVPRPSEVRATVAAFNAAIARVVSAEGARLVDLSARRDLIGLTSDDGFHPSTRGHRLVARAFARVLRG